MDTLQLLMGRRGIKMPPESVVRSLVITCVQDSIGIELQRTQIHLNGKTISIDTEPAIRSAIRAILPDIQACCKEAGIEIEKVF